MAKGNAYKMGKNGKDYQKGKSRRDGKQIAGNFFSEGVEAYEGEKKDVFVEAEILQSLTTCCGSFPCTCSQLTAENNLKTGELAESICHCPTCHYQGHLLDCAGGIDPYDCNACPKSAIAI